MSRIGNKPVKLPAGVTVEIKDKVAEVKGPKGTINVTLNSGIKVEVEDEEVKFSRENELKQTRQNHGTVRANVQNAVVGVSEGYKKELTMIGIGYKSAIESNGSITLWAGYSHTINIQPLEGVKISLGKDATNIIVEGIDKQKVGQTAALIREVRPPEPYLGKGIRYKNEYVATKEGKRAAAGK